jgi:serine/threonine protein kinase/hemoglobin-like flavoprotein/class 3 adenylate cyclase
MSDSGDLPTGVILDNEFEIKRLLRHGGMGSVYEAIQLKTGASRALKVMRSGLTHDANFLSRFEREARVSSSIPSDHVVQILGTGVDQERAIPYIAMELLDGEDLGDWLERHRRMSLTDTVSVVAQLCHALGAAHSVGIVHRDIKPENVFLARSRTVGMPFVIKVLDFGVAKIMSESRAATIAVGTPYYMAPEQTQPSSDIAPTVDIWALGLIVFRLLTGFNYWRAANESTESLGSLWREILIDPLPSASERANALGVSDTLPIGFDTWFARCVTREPSDRYANGNEAHTELLQLLAKSSQTPSSVVDQSGVQFRSDDQNQSPARAANDSPLSLATTATRARSRITFREGRERIVASSEVGVSLLDISLAAGIPHYHACGGRARCTTCRVVVLEGIEHAGPPTQAEERLAQARQWPPSIRLACQLKPTGDMTVRRLVVDNNDANAVNALQITQEPSAEDCVVFYIKLVGFDTFARKQFPHDAVHVLNRYLRSAVEPIFANHGRILRYETSGVLAAFGGPGDLRDTSATHAIRAALRVISRIRQINPYTLKHFGQEFDVAVGVEAGTVLQASVGHHSAPQPLAFGEAVEGAIAAATAAAKAGIHIAGGTTILQALQGKLRVSPTTMTTTVGKQVHEILDFAQPDVVFLVQSTFELLGERTDPFAAAFYNRLFESCPETKPLFSDTDMSSQRQMLMAVIGTVVRGLDKFNELIPTIEELGRRHSGYGVRPVHYKHVGNALIKTLEEFLADLFTPEVHVAWMEIYGQLARTMIGATQPTARAG